MLKPVFYDCEICGHFHPWDWNGDCRDDANRFSYNQLDAKYGANRYVILDMDERIAADSGENVSCETFIPLADLDAWEAFWLANAEALSEIADKETCYRLACNQELIIGGGAAPLFRVGFVDE